MKLSFTYFFCALLIFSVHSTFACSVMERSFCETAQHYQVVAKARVIDTIHHGIRLEVLEVLRGQENRDTITIWDGTDFECNGTFPMNASMMGQPGDTILTVLPKIDTIQNNWDVIGDYRRPDYFGWTTHLLLRSDTLMGYVAGTIFMPASAQLYKMAYADFTAWWYSHEKNCMTLTDIKVLQEDQLIVYPNPVDDWIYFEGISSGADLKLYSTDGRLLFQRSIMENKINVTTLPQGIYTLVITQNHQLLTRNFLKL